MNCSNLGAGCNPPSPERRSGLGFEEGVAHLVADLQPDLRRNAPAEVAELEAALPNLDDETCRDKSRHLSSVKKATPSSDREQRQGATSRDRTRQSMWSNWKSV